MKVIDAVKNTAFTAAINSGLKYLEKDPEVNIPKLMSLVDKAAPEGWYEGARNMIRNAIEEKGNWYDLIMKIYQLDPGVRKNFFQNFIVNASLKGSAIHQDIMAKEDCNVPWAILLDPTSACNLHCTGCWAAEYGNRLNLTYNDLDSVITQGKELGIFVLPMPFFIDGELYLEDITLSQSEFYEKLGADSDISTSQPSPGEVMDLWDKVLEEYDELVCIPMSSSLSSTCATAITLAAEYDGRVQVVDNQRISVTQEQSVLDAMNLREEGKSAAEIKEILEKEKLQASIYITVDTLKYLKKGGRITPAAAAIGTVLNLKPVLQIQGEKLDAFSKARGWKTAKKTMLNAIEKDLNGRFADVKDQMALGMAYTCSKEEAQEWKAEIEERFPGYEIMEGPLSLSVACHIGPGALAITCMKRL